MTRLACLALLLTAACGSNLHLASTPWPPFVDEPGEPRIAIEIVRRALVRSGRGAAQEIVPNGTLTGALRAGTYDGTAAIWRGEERERFLLYSRPYLENRIVLVGRAGSDVSAVSLSELAGKRIGIVEGYAYGEMVTEAQGPVLVEAETVTEHLQAIIDGELDYALVDDLEVHHLFEEYREQARGAFAVGTVPLARRTLHFAVRRDLADAERIVADFNRAVLEMLGDGTYNEVLGLLWIRTDVDQDGRYELVFGGDRAGEAPPEDSYDLMLEEGPTERPREPERFRVNGQNYDRWDDIPEEYRTPGEDQVPGRFRSAQPSPIRVLEF
ncbi:MAG: substrate-binding periplasmic protein [Sandaracinaceae bacterium]